MNKIEAKRKELIKTYQEEPTNVKNKDERMWKIMQNMGMLDGFNLGVSMARKEFLDKINKLKIKLVKQLRGKNVAFTKEEDISLFEQNFKELKQSLEEKHE